MDSLLRNTMILLVIIYPLHIGAFSNGTVLSACTSMRPNHNVTAQSSTPPYSLSLSKNNYTSGEKITVTLKNTSADAVMEGLLIQARDGSSTTPLGYFEISTAGTPDVQKLTCTTEASTVSHNSNSKKSVVQVTWVAPNGNFSNIRLRATVVKTFNMFWEEILSENLTYSGSLYLVPSLSQMFLCLTVLLCALHAL